MSRGTKVVIIGIAVMCIFVGMLWDTIRTGAAGGLGDGDDSVKVQIRGTRQNRIVMPRDSAESGSPASPAQLEDAFDKSRGNRAPVKSRATATATTWHTVKPGQSLSTIAREYYGRSSLWPRIAAANPGLTPKNLRVGKRIRIPAALVKAPAKAGQSPKAPPGWKRYTIKPGDTLQRIARREYGSSTRYRRILKANPSLKPRTLRPGKTILLPPKGR